jgi:hypothetical protein
MTQIERKREKELAYRESDGVAVSLRWNRETRVKRSLTK